jgi:hypothetical protein
LKPYLVDRPSQPWTLFSCTTTEHKKSRGKKTSTIKKRSTNRSDKTSRKDTPHPIVMKETAVMENEPQSVEQP